MAETYEEIIKEIEALAEEANLYPTIKYRDKYELGGSDPDEIYELEVLKHLCARVRDAVAGDPREWWVEDADGNHVHIGEVVNGLNKSCLKGRHRVQGFICDGARMVFNDGFSCNNDEVTKVTPDTREKIIEETIAKWKRIPLDWRDHEAERVAIINEAINRAMKLSEVDA